MISPGLVHDGSVGTGCPGLLVIGEPAESMIAERRPENGSPPGFVSFMSSFCLPLYQSDLCVFALVRFSPAILVVVVVAAAVMAVTVVVVAV